jgi:hypothetical protein
MTFLLAEDKALRELLQGVTVSDQKSENSNTVRPIGVWFGQPDQELRNQNYPYVTIQMIDVARDNTREMRGKTSREYLRDETISSDAPFIANRPIPVNIDYQITTYARHPRHDRELLAKILYSKLPFRFGTLNCDDDTVRRLDVLDVTKRDVTEQAKRLFVNVFTVRVSSEIPDGVLKQLYKVLEVHVDPPTVENAGGRPGFPNYYGVDRVIIRDNLAPIENNN